GDNGAGKSTLLKLIAGVIRPTVGELKVRGSRLAILDLSVGLNEELSGRDNVLQQLGLYGLSRQDAAARVEDIIRFAELEAVMDRPMKTYSSGMKVRLGFSILTSQSPDLLLIDEALSVGDLAFQQKSIQRMMDFKEQGKTIIFCSHSLYQIEQFCDQALWMKGGQVAMYGPSHHVLQAYDKYQLSKAKQPLADASEQGETPLRISRVRVSPPPPLEQGQTLAFHADVEAVDPGMRFHYTLSIRINGERGLVVVGSHLRGDAPLQGSGHMAIVLPEHPIASGHYTFHLRLWDESGMVVISEAALPDVEFVKSDRLLGMIRTPYRCDWQQAA
ncbi:MAG TPA: ATP-binding cassette domain-containing protein, partial [Burkholderiaceae bacterium]|nr:ATP-binding cassette domain-containing protein [Burkholderiaceae bacterium]